TLAFVAAPEANARALYVRGTGSLTTRELSGTADASQPFWSADSRFIGFVTGGKLKKIDAEGGPAQLICDAPGFTGGTWSPSGTIIFGTPEGLFKVSAEGGVPEALTKVEAPETGHYWPHAMPDGRHFLYLAWSAEPTGRAIYTSSLDGTERAKLVAAESNVAYASPGYLLFHREATVFAQPFDASSLDFSGDAVQVAGGVSFDSSNGRGHFDVSQAGVLLYFEGAASATSGTRAGSTTATSLAWVDRAGTTVGIADPGGGPSYGDFDLSPDGSQIAITRRGDAGATGADIWIIDWRRSVTSRLTLDPGDNINPVWSSDNARVAFTTHRNGNADVFVMNANGVGAAEPLLSSPKDERIEAWSKDGRFIAYELGEGAMENIWVLPLSNEGPGEPFVVVEGPYRKGEVQFSPDGRWLAFASDETGQFEVYLQSFPDGAERTKVSTDGGGQPRWSPDGKELYYRNQAQIRVVDITGTDPLGVSSPRDLFRAVYTGNASTDPLRHGWSVAPDGRFLVRVPLALGGGRGTMPTAPTVILPQGASGRGRGTQPGSVLEGLTVVRDWPAGLQGRAR
ncbi:MAG TPA: hypothetical protein VLD67_15850, partial [Vicinamibacterales bacterium]|nr:hypothetical protein [Vicinamibacterales bacterium]